MVIAKNSFSPRKKRRLAAVFVSFYVTVKVIGEEKGKRGERRSVEVCCSA
jgi:hypothetical protein